MAPSEKPVLLQKRRLEQAGYNEEDKIEDVGREDHSYLIKYIYKTEAGRTFGSVRFKMLFRLRDQRLIVTYSNKTTISSTDTSLSTSTLAVCRPSRSTSTDERTSSSAFNCRRTRSSSCLLTSFRHAWR